MDWTGRPPWRGRWRLPTEVTLADQRRAEGTRSRQRTERSTVGSTRRKVSDQLSVKSERSTVGSQEAQSNGVYRHLSWAAGFAPLSRSSRARSERPFLA